MIRPPTAEEPRSVSILGATGSVGRSTLALLAEAPERYRVEALTAARNVEALAYAARGTGARFAAIAEERCYAELKDALAGSDVEAAAGREAVVEAAARDAQWVMAAIVGAAGLMPTLKALERGAMVALANKECLVCAGRLFIDAARRGRATILPVDSEHNAIFQALAGSAPDDVDHLVLTASGGPFRQRSLEQMALADPAEAVAHPNWSMGAKISVDSATMMNKGLEIIEATHLFVMPEERVHVVVHPQSVVHSLVAFRDGSLLAQLGAPDMRIPISHALGWPRRLTTTSPKISLTDIARLDFEPPDVERFPALRLARAAVRAGDGAATVLNAANEVAVEAFLDCQIGFLDICRTVETVLSEMAAPPLDDLESVVALDREARARASLASSRCT